ncbi:MAG TPA: T9SS type A sorting domain-containing protein [Flavobacteriales bacterium]|nr:T9SS type A sorting domain-containing protein [Flavobacteriales bacterium]
MRSSFTLLLCASLSITTPARAQSWTLDPDFADEGRLIIDVDQSIDEVSSMAVRDDGKILIAGWATPFSLNFSGAIVAQVGPDGVLDESFGHLGIAGTYLSDRSLFANAMVEQPDHAVILAGGSVNTLSERDAIVLRYLADGSADPDFGADSMVTTDLGGNEVFTAVALDDLGRIICAGRVGGSILVVRYDAGGVLDPGFGIGGVQEVPLGLGTLSGYVGMGLCSDGKIALACPSVDGLVLARLEEDGDPDATFGTDGVITTGEEIAFHALLVQPDDFVLIGGGAPLDVNEECQGFQLMRYDPEGILDPALDGDGIARTLISAGCPELFGLALLSDGRILASGTGNSEDTFADLTAVRYLPDGSLDPTFDDDGMVLVDMGCNAMDVAYTIALETDDDVVVAGLTDCGQWPNDIAAIRLQPEVNTAIGGPAPRTGVASVQPNPAQDETWLEYTITTDQAVSLELRDVQGRRVNGLLAQQPRPAGTYREALALDGLSAGLYTAVLSHGDAVERVRFVKE